MPLSRFADLVECISDTCHPSAAETDVYVGLEHIDSGGFELARFGHPDNVTSAKNRFRCGDILYGKLRPYLDKAILADREGICSTDILVFRPRREVVPAFALGVIHSGAFRDNAVATTQGVNHPRTSWNGLSSFEYFAPPRPEQQNIAAVLWTLQRAIATQDRLMAATHDLKASAMQRLFTHGLRGEPLKETEIGAMPESWEIISLGDLGRIGNGSTPKKTTAAYWRDPTTPWLTSAKVHEGIIRSADQFVSDIAVKECHLPIVPVGSLLVAITGQGKTLGNSALVELDTTINQHLAYVRFDREGVFPRYVYQFMRSRYEELQGIGRAGGSTKAALTCAFLRSYQLPLPSTSEQRAIATALATVDRKLAHHRKKRAALDDLFQTLLHQLMTAQVRVVDLEIDTREVVPAAQGETA